MGGVLGRAALFIAGVCALAAPAQAQVQPPGTGDPGGFRNVLGVGQGRGVNAVEAAEFVALGTRPAAFTNQLPLYRDLGPRAPEVSAGNLSQFFKQAGFGVQESQVAETITPRPGVTILIDNLSIPHVYGNTRSDVHFGAGYASGRLRMFMMDVLRHTARGTLTELVGPGSGMSMDLDQLRVADYTEPELEQMIETTAATAGSEGAEIKQDLLDYVAGINAYIADVRGNLLTQPGEYALLGVPLEDWKPTDTAAVASLIGGIFGKGGGVETRDAAVLSAARARFGRSGGARVMGDFRALNDPEAPVTTPRRFNFPDPRGKRHRKLRRKAVALPDLGSVEEYDPVVGGAAAAAAGARSRSRAQGWLRQLREHGLALAGPASNATLVSGAHSVSGRPLAATGPQVAYYSPEILFEMDLHGGGVDTRGVAFPGISLYVLLGRGKDFSWSATTATTDNVDEFVERLCEPDGSPPTRESTHYRYRGSCIPMKVQNRVLHTPGPSIADPGATAREIRLRLLRTVHGPVTRTATVRGKPVAIASARSTYFHELDSTIAFKRLNRNEVTDARSFQDAMGRINFLFNWFYSDERDIAYFQSGWFPLRAAGTDPSLPTWGTGRFDWRGFDPAGFNSKRAAFKRLPKDINPKRGYITSWNNKQAPGWRAADDVWSFGSIQRVERLEDRVRSAIAGGAKIDLPKLVSIMGDAGTVDVRGQEVLPWLLQVIGKPRTGQEQRLMGLLSAWVASGSHRVDRNGDNLYEHSGAVALMDAWWEPLVRGIYEPVLGHDLVERIRAVNSLHQAPGPGGSAFFDGWYGYVEKDLRTLLGRKVRGRYSRRYCGGGSVRKGRGFAKRRRASRRRCRAILVSTLEQAAGAAEKRYGAPLESLGVPATCPVQRTAACDQITFTATGAIETDPIPWQDRGTFQQAVEVQGDRP